jgi:UDP-N-acetylmuramoylalanine--D-glutamate ligase
MAAICATYGYVRNSAVGDVADEFLGVKHRIEPVATVDSVTYFNSSIDSSPARSCVTLDALGGKNVVICGGRNKNLSFDILADKLSERACAAVLTGEAADEIKDTIDKSEACREAGLCVFVEIDFNKAFEKASSIALSLGGKQTVVLSPACTSFDAFDNFERRGEYFKSLVMKLKCEKNKAVKEKCSENE